MEVQAVFHIYNINNNKQEHEKKNNRGERLINIFFPPSTWERFAPTHLLPILRIVWKLWMDTLDTFATCLRLSGLWLSGPLLSGLWPSGPWALWLSGPQALWSLALWPFGPLALRPAAFSSLSIFLHHLWPKERRRAWLIYIFWGYIPCFHLGTSFLIPKPVDQKKL